MFWRKPFFANVMEAEEFHTEAIHIKNSDMSERETNDREMSEMYSDSGLMANICKNGST